jgi:hypothetical protein
LANASPPPIALCQGPDTRFLAAFSYERVPLLDAAGLEERFGVTFFGMGRGYRDDPIFRGVSAVVALDERPKEAV